MIDLYFAPIEKKRIFDCGRCRKNPVTAKRRACDDEGFQNLKKPMKVDSTGGYDLAFNFCPGKATWYPEIAEVFGQCRVALESGILPDSGALTDQGELFYEVFPYFVERWKERTYGRMWGDVQDFTLQVLKGIFGKGKSGGK